MPAVVLVTGILLIFTSSVSIAWETRLDEDGILIQSRLNPDAKYQEFRARVTVEATLAQAIALLNDTAACTRWLFRCKESRLIRDISATERTFYQVTSLPFPARSRDSVFHASLTFDDQGTVSIAMTSVPDDIPVTKHVRVKEAFGFYRLKPVGDNQLMVTWQHYIDPAGALPAWLVNSMLTDLPFKSLQAFRKLVRQAPYKDATLIYDADGNPVGIGFTDSTD